MKRILMVLAATAVLAGCGDATAGGGGALQVSDIAGTWNATTFVFTSTASSSSKFDFIANGGAMSLVITADGKITTDQVGANTEMDSGTISISGSTVTITLKAGSDVSTGPISLSGNTLTMDLTGNKTNWDFDNNGIEESASIHFVFTRA